MIRLVTGVYKEIQLLYIIYTVSVVVIYYRYYTTISIIISIRYETKLQSTLYVYYVQILTCNRVFQYILLCIYFNLEKKFFFLNNNTGPIQ